MTLQPKEDSRRRMFCLMPKSYATTCSNTLIYQHKPQVAPVHNLPGLCLPPFQDSRN